MSKSSDGLEADIIMVVELAELYNPPERDLSPAEYRLRILKDLEKAEWAANIIMADEGIERYIDALTLMCLQLGEAGTRSFVNMLDQMSIGNYGGVVMELLDSRWFAQRPSRVRDVVRCVLRNHGIGCGAACPLKKTDEDF